MKKNYTVESFIAQALRHYLTLFILLNLPTDMSVRRRGGELLPYGGNERQERMISQTGVHFGFSRVGIGILN